MKQVLNQVAWIKKIDAGCQIVVLLLTIFAITQIGLIGMYVMAIAQCISCVMWAIFFHGDIPRYRGGTIIRKAFLIVLCLLLVSLFDGGAFFGVSMALIFIGPIMGITYFFIGLKEINFYSKARKPYYLL